MIKIENVEVFNINGAMRGMRNPLNSWHRNDTVDNTVGENDKDLSTRLVNAGNEHAKFMRQIFVSMDITAPLYWVQEFDTYKVGTTRNSCSFQHKGLSKEFELNDFEIDNMFDLASDTIKNYHMQETIDYLNSLREYYNHSASQEERIAIFRVIRQILPSGYKYKFTWTGSYANLRDMYQQRKNHKLVEWQDFLGQLEKELPMFDEWIKAEKK